MNLCRHCHTPLEHVFVDLGTAPPSNSYLKTTQLNEVEKFYPLKVFVCSQCFLVQIDEVKQHEEIFDEEYAYFSSISSSWLAHCEHYTEMICERFQLGRESHVVEIASNDGYLLQYFQERGIPCLGIEPTASTASEARKKGLEVIEEFFHESLALDLKTANRQADLMIANNVLAHVPDLNGFLRGFQVLLKEEGVATFEFPHLFELVENRQFDTIYHEHFSYLSLYTVEKVCKTLGLRIFDVQQLPTHGGSLRVYVCKEAANHPTSPAVEKILAKETTHGINSLEYYKGFQSQIEEIKFSLLRFLLDAKAVGKKVAAYGAAAKGNTLLNFAGITRDLLSYVADLSPHKQGKLLPGSRIPIVSPEELLERKPDIVLVLPWNIQNEIIEQLKVVGDWGGQFVVAIPELKIISE